MKNVYSLAILWIALLASAEVYGQRSCTWKGRVSTEWSNPDNWTCKSVPNSSTTSVIISSAVNEPVIGATEIISVRNIALDKGALLTNNGILRISGSITKTGLINSEGGEIDLDGVEMQDIAGARFTSYTIKILSIDNSSSVTLTDSLRISGVLNINSGNFDLNGNSLTIISTADNTARVGPVGGTLSNDGRVTVERYIPKERRAYRILAPSVNTTTSINANWQEGVHNTVFGINIDPHPGYGIQITGEGGAANNFDVTATNQPSLFLFNCDCDNPWLPVPNTNGTLDGKTGYLVFVRGDRSTDMTSTADPLPTSATTLRATGTLLRGTQTYSNLSDTGHSLITNPYASPINWRTMYFHNDPSRFENYYTYWDPTIGERGGYVTVTIDGVNSAGTDATVDIQSGLAFFVKGKIQGSAGTFIIQESDKSKKSNINMFAPERGGKLSVKLYYDGANERKLADGMVAIFNDDYSKDIDNYDAGKMSNWDENIAWVVGAKHLSIQSHPLIAGSEKLGIFINHLKERNYQIDIEGKNFNYPGTAELVDNYTLSRTTLNAGRTTVSFSVTADPRSKAPDRFYIEFRNDVPVAVAVKSSVSVYPNPVVGNVIHLQLNDMSKGAYVITLTDPAGRVIYSKQIEHPGGTDVQTIDVGGKITQGVYVLRVGGESVSVIKN
jgi:hypothetical protein